MILSVAGGLGNQCFSLAALIHWAYVHGYGMAPLAIEQSPSIFQARNVYWKTLFHQIPTVTKTAFAAGELMVHQDWDPTQGFKPIVCPRNQSLELKGYFQHLRHFWKYRRIVLGLLRAPGLDKQAKSFLDCKSINPKTTAFMHFRRGDYKRLPHVFPILPLEYYKIAMIHYARDVKFLVLCETEDKDALRKEVQTNMNQQEQDRLLWFPDLNTQSEETQLMMMKSCERGGIVANSTFSVWGAYLQQTEHPCGPFVYSESYFTHAPTTPPQIFDPTWIRLPTQLQSYSRLAHSRMDKQFETWATKS